MGGVAIGLLPWTVYLSVTLPPKHESVHWDIVWPGLDVGIALAVAVTVYGLVRLSTNLPIFAAIAGTLLLCDAWFDVVTSGGGSERVEAVLEAVFAELPLAAVCVFIVVDTERFLGATTVRYGELLRRLRGR